MASQSHGLIPSLSGGRYFEATNPMQIVATVGRATRASLIARAKCGRATQRTTDASDSTIRVGPVTAVAGPLSAPMGITVPSLYLV